MTDDVKSPLLANGNSIDIGNTADHGTYTTKKELTVNSGNNFSKALCLAYLMIVILNITESFSVIAAQLALAKTSIFELNCIKYPMQVIIYVVVILCKGYSFRINPSHWKFVLGSSVFDYIYCVCVYVTATYLPVGSIQGVSTSLFILFSVVVDIFKKHTRKSTLICALFSCSGIILLVQPWRLTQPHTQAKCVPCDIFDHAIINGSRCFGNTADSNVTNNTTHRVADVASLNKNLIVGYVLVFVSAVAATLCSNSSHVLVRIYQIPTVIFWTSVLGSIFSVIITAITKSIAGQDWLLPTGKFCLSLALLFVAMTSFNYMLWFVTYSLVAVSQLSLGTSPTVVILYICQRTFLKPYFPGYANVLESLGAVSAFVGAALLPILDIFHGCKNVSNKQ